MPLDPQVKALLDRLVAMAAPSLTTLTPQKACQGMEEATALLGTPPWVDRVEDREIDGPRGPIRIRLYAPETPATLPALVYFHGGGWVIGSIETHDGLCRALANAARIAVVSVDYRLAPEHPYPAGVDDAYAATCWIAAHAEDLWIDSERIAVGGDSAGGNLAAVVALKAREFGSPRLAFQLLIYPITNNDLDTPSYLENAEGFMLTRAEMAWFWGHYLASPEQGSEPYVSPLRAEDLAGLPPALVITAEYDPLRDEGETYAARLQQAGVPTMLVRYPGMIHGFLRRYTLLDKGRDALHEVGEALRRALGTGMSDGR